MQRDDLDIKVPWPGPEGKRRLFACIALLILVGLCYSNSFNASWHFDDYENIVHNQNVQLKHLTWPEIERSLYGISPLHRWSRPVSYFSFALNYYLDGQNVFGYHLVNFFIHYLATVLLFFFIHRTLQLPILKGRYTAQAYSIALLATTLWAIHPLQVTAVTYIVQRMTSLCALFYILAFYAYLRGRTAYAVPARIGWFTLTALAGLLAVGTKENAAMLPVTLYLYDLLLLQGVTAERLKRSALVIVAASLTVIAVGFLYFGDLSSLIGDYGTRPFTMEERVLTQPRVIVTYLSLLLYPITDHLMLVHDFTFSRSLFDPWTTAAAILFILILNGLALLLARKRPLFAFCVLFFFVNHLIEGSFLSLELFYEHRNYLPSMLFFVPIAFLGVRALQALRPKGGLFGLLAFATTAILIILGMTVYMQNNIYQDEVTLWMDNVEKTPHLHHPRQNLAVALFMAGRLDEAYVELQKALEAQTSGNIRKKYTTHACLGEYYLIKGKDDLAYGHYEIAAQLAKEAGGERPEPFHRMAQILLRRDNLPKAESMVRRALAIRPAIGEYHLTYSLILLKKGDPDEAIREARQALILDPDDRFPYRVFAEAFTRRGQPRAAAHYQSLAGPPAGPFAPQP